jgi:hypothetical protein
MPIQFITPSIISSVANTQVTGTITTNQLSGSITSDKITSVNANTITTGTIPVSQVPRLTGVKMPTGSILQVIQGTITSAQLTVAAGQALANTGIAASITPTSASSKILVTPNLTTLYNGNAGGMAFAIYRGATIIYLHGYSQAGGYLGSLYSPDGFLGAVSFSYLDSPATTSETTYSVYWGAFQNSAFINYQGSSTVNGTGSYITLMEIAG